MAQLSDSQLVVLTAACQRPDRCVFPVNPKLKGNAAGNVLKSLLNKSLIKEVRAKRDDTVWRHDKNHGKMTLRATRAAFDALGIDPKEIAATEDDTEEASATAETTGDGSKTGKSPSKSKSRRPADQKQTRAGSKQAQLIEMLKSPDGATIEEIVKKFKWQAHTVRGAIAGALKKKLGLNVQSEKVEDRGRVYRIA
ncbi:MAG: DUF3489 domain-containing protein [Pseudorhodoplanes sp.]|nr:DUF3489 domain-containing protein [Pseudorhodoplanes sp.]